MIIGPRPFHIIVLNHKPKSKTIRLGSHIGVHVARTYHILQYKLQETDLWIFMFYNTQIRTDTWITDPHNNI